MDRAEAPDERRMYRDLSWIFPIISPPEDYAPESAEFAAEILAHAQGEVKTLLDLGCGAGHYDFNLKPHFAITGIDISEAMLALARRLNPEATYHLGDMREARLGQTFDAVLIGDAVNYMLTEDDLRRALTTAFVHLRPGGVLCVTAEDVRENFQQGRTDCSFHRGEGVDVTFMESSYDPDPADTTFEVTYIYLIRRQGKLSVEIDPHLSGLFSLADWRRLLAEVGFVDVEQHSFAGDYPLFVARRP